MKAYGRIIATVETVLGVEQRPSYKGQVRNYALGIIPYWSTLRRVYHSGTEDQVFYNLEEAVQEVINKLDSMYKTSKKKVVQIIVGSPETGKFWSKEPNEFEV